MVTLLPTDVFCNKNSAVRLSFFKSNFDGIVSSVDKRTELIGDTHYKEASFYNYSTIRKNKIYCKLPYLSPIKIIIKIYPIIR